LCCEIEEGLSGGERGGVGEGFDRLLPPVLRTFKGFEGAPQVSLVEL